MTSGPRTVRAPHGSQLSCKGWPQEAAMRMLMNNLDPDIAEHPDQLIVYGGGGKAARSWAAYDAIVASLQELGPEETLLVQSGKPVGIFQTHEWAPRVLIANANLVPDWATWEEFRRLDALGLTMFGQMTAGSWIYIGTQGILQGTYETFAAVAEKRHGGSLAGTVTLTAGLGGMGGAQPMAVTMNGGVVLCVEVDPIADPAATRHRLSRRRRRQCRRRARRAAEAKAKREALSIGILANAADVVPHLLAIGAEIDVVTDQTSAHDPLMYVPRGVGVGRDGGPAGKGPRGTHEDGPRVDGRTRRGDGRLPRRGRRGVRLRQLDPRRGEDGWLRARLRLPWLRPRLHPAPVLPGQGTVPLGGAVGRPARHRRHRPGGALGVPGQRVARPLDPHGRRTRALPGAAGSDLLARLRRARPAGAALQRHGRQRQPCKRRSSSVATTSTAARSPRPTGRPKPCATGRTRSPTGRF